MEVHERVNRVIEDRGITQTALAIRLGKSYDWLNARLIGRTKIKVDELPQIAAALRVDPCWLLMGDDALRTAATHHEPPDSADQMYDRYAEILTAMGIGPEDSDLVIAVAEFLRTRRQRLPAGG